MIQYEFITKTRLRAVIAFLETIILPTCDFSSYRRSFTSKFFGYLLQS